MKDSEVMNIFTGEILSATDAIHLYYSDKRHGCLDSWTDEWKETGRYTEKDLMPPDFSKMVNI